MRDFNILRLILGLLGALAMGLGVALLIVWLVPLRGMGLTLIMASVTCPLTAYLCLLAMGWVLKVQDSL